MDNNTLPSTVPALQMALIKAREIIVSHEAARKLRLAEEEAAAATSPAASFELDIADARRDLEGLADGSEDYESTSERTRICNKALNLIGRLRTALQKA
jgi:hypothetical protein